MTQQYVNTAAVKTHGVAKRWYVRTELLHGKKSITIDITQNQYHCMPLHCNNDRILWLKGNETKKNKYESFGPYFLI